MKKELIFLIFCVITTLISLVTIIKTNINNTKLELKYSHNTNKNSSLTKFIIEPKCNSNFVVWIVTSPVNDPLYRTALRRAYPNEMLKSLNITRVFLLGMSKEESIWEYIIQESQQYNDLLQGDFLESYRNLTLKHLMGLRWASSNCRSTFLIKTDNDIVLDVFEMLKLLKKKTMNENAISGYVLRKMKPIRISNNKWFVTNEDFSGDVYPDFLSGWFYITNLKVAQLLVYASEKIKNFLWIDDVFITGILRQKYDIKIEELNSLFATDYRYLECCIRDKKWKLKCGFIAGPDGDKKELHIKFKEFSEYCQWNCTERMKKQLVSKTCVATYEEKINIINSKVQVHYI
ncbi:beta-1,3-galactosyltransferase 5 isoform X1 [Frieseomelitta varia]|uniref:beta-1,3-galactosyltransferase 5 isoform X1 n=1 Tax=Frieseomelitta varia TaxID=561572 RepID=UPI001CB67FBB|nr:beta-1,3-galactosyltransferase 5 isoform X1 [Frieseomelitta varia]XP_043508319.1 beta-1,3-galactosyltransferase 5 isoform X1 [Frieseomelitta varia]